MGHTGVTGGRRAIITTDIAGGPGRPRTGPQSSPFGGDRVGFSTFPGRADGRPWRPRSRQGSTGLAGGPVVEERVDGFPALRWAAGLPR